MSKYNSQESDEINSKFPLKSYLHIEESFSEHGEDLLILDMHPKQGFYIDVGAYDGVRLSNTYMLEQNGWRGICIEPNYDMFCKLISNRPHSFCINSAVVSPWNKSVAKFYHEPTGLMGGLKPDVESVSHHYNVAGVQEPFRGFDECYTQTITLDNAILISGIPRVDVLSIDTEGTDMEVLSGLSLNKWKPQIIICESVSNPDIEEYLNIFKYVLYKELEINQVFVLRE